MSPAVQGQRDLTYLKKSEYLKLVPVKSVFPPQDETEEGA